MTIIVVILDLTRAYQLPPHPCDPTLPQRCQNGSYRIVETIPYGSINETLPSPFQSTSDAWIDLISSANSTIAIAASYVSLNATESYNTDPWEEWGHSVGEQIYSLLIDAHSRGVDIKIIENAPGSEDTFQLQTMGVAEVRYANVTALRGSGILHAKFIIVDNSTFYLGSANMDWRALTQVKEIGIVVHSNCLTEDLLNIFELYWTLPELNHLPFALHEEIIESSIFIPSCFDVITNASTTTQNVTTWPFDLQAFYNRTSPSDVHLQAVDVHVPTEQPDFSTYITSAPKDFCGPFRTDDLEGTLALLHEEEQSICISVMDYAPITFYDQNTTYWPVIDDALRRAAIERGVSVKLLVGHWNYSRESNNQYLLSLDSISNIEVLFFDIPAIPGVQIPHTRVNHAKFVVTSKAASITTSNWSADYFLSTGGVSYITNDSTMISQVQGIFDRDWSSMYSSPVPNPSCPT